MWHSWQGFLCAAAVERVQSEYVGSMITPLTGCVAE
jgi:hypothetical protein